MSGQRVVVRSGQGRLHVAHELPGVGYLGVCRSLIVRPSAVEALTPEQARRLHAAAPGAVCHYCAIVAAEVERALDAALERELEGQQLEAQLLELHERELDAIDEHERESEAAFIRRYGPGVL